MTDEEFEILWQKGKEHDSRELEAILSQWNKMSLVEKERFVMESETRRFWENLNDDDSEIDFSRPQMEFLREYAKIAVKLGLINPSEIN